MTTYYKGWTVQTTRCSVGYQAQMFCGDDSIELQQKFLSPDDAIATAKKEIDRIIDAEEEMEMIERVNAYTANLKEHEIPDD